MLGLPLVNSRLCAAARFVVAVGVLVAGIRGRAAGSLLSSEAEADC